MIDMYFLIKFISCRFLNSLQKPLDCILLKSFVVILLWPVLLLFFTAIWLWEIYLNSLSLSFLICKMKPIILTVLVFFYCVANYQKLSNLKQHVYYLTISMGQKESGRLLCSGSQQNAITVSVRAGIPPEAQILFQAHMVPSSCRNEACGFYRLLPTPALPCGTLHKMKLSFFKASREDRVCCWF